MTHPLAGTRCCTRCFHDQGCLDRLCPCHRQVARSPHQRPLALPPRRRSLFPRRSRPSELELVARDLVRAQNVPAADFDPDQFAILRLCFLGTLGATARDPGERSVTPRRAHARAEALCLLTDRSLMKLPDEARGIVQAVNEAADAADAAAAAVEA